LFSFSSSSHR